MQFFPRGFLMVAVLFATGGCANQTTKEESLFQRRVADGNNTLSMYSTKRETSKTELRAVGPCRFHVWTQWPSKNSAVKGYASATSEYEINAEEDIDSVEFMPAHEVVFEGITQRWSTSFRIIFNKKIVVQNSYLPLGRQVWIPDEFEAAFMTIDAVGVASDDENYQVVKSLQSLAPACKPTPGK